MARDRSKDEILDQLVYAVAAVARHYGPGLSTEGLRDIRKKLDEDDWWCDARWRVDVLEGGDDGNPDFCPSVIPNDYYGLDFEETINRARTGED